MSFFTKFFSNKPQRQLTRAEVVTGNTAIFTSWSGNAYANDIYRGAVDAIARNCGKLHGAHFVKYNGTKKDTTDQKLNRLLQVAPNEYMNSYDFLYKLCTHYSIMLLLTLTGIITVIYLVFTLLLVHRLIL